MRKASTWNAAHNHIVPGTHDSHFPGTRHTPRIGRRHRQAYLQHPSSFPSSTLGKPHYGLPFHATTASAANTFGPKLGLAPRPEHETSSAQDVLEKQIIFTISTEPFKGLRSETTSLSLGGLAHLQLVASKKRRLDKPLVGIVTECRRRFREASQVCLVALLCMFGKQESLGFTAVISVPVV